MDSLSSLGVFVQAAELRNFTAAARQMGVSSSAVGKSIARLEDRLGVRLFHRSTRTITLTSDGAIFLARCKRIFSEVEAAELELANGKSAPRGKLKISMPLLGMLLMPLISKFALAYPEIELDIDFSDRMVDVINEGFDAVLRTGESSDSRLMGRTLGSFSHKIVASPSYFAKQGIPLRPLDLKDHACLQHRFPSTGKLEVWPIQQDGSPVEVDLPNRATASTLEPLIFLAEEGVGIACVPYFTIRKQIASGALVAVLDEYVQNNRPFKILWPSSKLASPKVDVFINFMAKELFTG